MVQINADNTLLINELVEDAIELFWNAAAFCTEIFTVAMKGKLFYFRLFDHPVQVGYLVTFVMFSFSAFFWDVCCWEPVGPVYLTVSEIKLTQGVFMCSVYANTRACFKLSGMDKALLHFQ